MLSFALQYPWIAAAEDRAPTYSESVQLAEDNAANPEGWTPPGLFVIPDTTSGATEGLIYDKGSLIVRTATKHPYFKWNYVGESGYKIYGSPETDATWVTTGNDVTNFLRANGVNGGNVTTLLERGLGMDATGTHDAIVEFAVDTHYLMRPTRNPDISTYVPSDYGTSRPFVKPEGMTENVFCNFKAYYENWLAGAYGSYPFPWTQLGYTFFWRNGYEPDRIKGMSEFIIPGQSPVDIYGIYATCSYIYTMNDGSDFSSAAHASYGNGFASFNIGGSCDTVWAGHRFQKNVRTKSETPNQVIISRDGAVSGGQGLLIWSLNYDVINEGVIGGPTADKFGVAGTSDIAVLFKGDRSGEYGAPVTNGVNRIVNSGVIASPGTAIKAAAGNTFVINSTCGVISGGEYAVQTGAGNDSVIVQGGELAGKVDLGTGTDLFSVTNTGSNATLRVALNRDTADQAQVRVKDSGAGTVHIADNTTLALTVTGETNVRNNDRFLIVDTAALTVTPECLVVRNDLSLPMVDFSATKEENRLYLVAARNAGYYAANSGNAPLGAIIDSLADSATGDMAVVLGNLDKSGSAANVGQMAPNADNGAMNTSYETMNGHIDAIRCRIGQVMKGTDEDEDAHSDASAEGAPECCTLWVQGFGAALDQEERGSSGGYDAHIWALSFGFDRFVSDHVIAGISGGYGRSRIRTDDAATGANADSYLGSLYGSLKWDAFYLEGVASFSCNYYDESRHIAFNTVNRRAEGEYRGRQYSGYLEGGYRFKYKEFLLTPFASAHYMKLKIDEYAERGAGTLNLNVSAQNFDMFQMGLGIQCARTILYGTIRIMPEIHATFLYDFVSDPRQTTSTFTGGGASFETKGFDPPKSSCNAGAALAIFATSSVTLSLTYDVEWRDDFSCHSGCLSLQYRF